MANRNDSDARQHETLPGPGPGTNAPIGGGGSGSGARPVEQVMDAAIDRIARERGGSFDRDGSFDLARRHQTASLARRDAGLAGPREPTRLRWKGHDVSDEFRQYAERIARGEQLPPFEGRVLAEPNPAFPWGEGTQPDEPPKKRSSHAAMWVAAVGVLGLLGWSVAVKLEGDAQNALVETSMAPLSAPASTPPEPAPIPSATPHDVVETPTPSAATPVTDPEPISASPEVAPAEPAATLAAPEPAAPSSISADALVSAPPSAPAAAATPAVSVDLARPGALQQAVGAALANRSSTPTAGTAVNTAPREDEFGIMTSGSPASGSPASGSPASGSPAPAAPAPVAPSPSPAPPGAKSNGNVGDLSRANQPSAPGVRKEPGSESSAKGSLLVDTPSF